MKIEDKITTFNTSSLMPTAKGNWFNFILARGSCQFVQLRVHGVGYAAGC